MGRRATPRLVSLTATYGALVAAALFVLATVWVQTRMSRRQSDLSALVGYVRHLVAMEESVEQLAAIEPESSTAEAIPARIDGLLAELAALKGGGLLPDGVPIDPVPFLDAATQALNVLAAAPPRRALQEGASATDVRAQHDFLDRCRTIDSTISTLTRQLRGVLGDISIELQHKVVLSQILLFIACLLAVLVGVLLALRHRTVSRQFEEQASRIELDQRMKVILEQAPIVVWSTDADLRVTSSSGAALRGLGLAQGELDGRTLFDYFGTTDRAFLPIARHFLAAAGTPQNYELTWQDRTFLVQLVPQRRDGEPPGVLGVAVDITERKQAESELTSTQVRLRHLAKMEAIGRLAGVVAHDFNNFLTVVLGYAGGLLDELPADAPHRFEIEEIARTAERATWLTRQLLAFSRPGKYETEAVDLGAVVRQMAPMVRRQCGAKIELLLDVAATVPPVLAHPAQMEQVVLNLAINARDAMPEGGRLTLAVRRDDDPEPTVVLSVRDTGVGMDEEVKARIFEPFFSLKGEGSGTGLGLAIVDAIVRERGGSISVESVPREGSVFHVRFPAATGLSVVEPLTEAEPTPVGRGERVLIVEDDDSVRTFAARTLEAHGYAVTTARSGVEALELLAERQGGLDLLLTDQRMARIPGHELARRVCERYGATRMILMSTHPSTAELTPANAPSGFLQKPFTSLTLLRHVRASLDAELPAEA